MKKTNFLLLVALCGTLLATSCKKKNDEPAPVVPAAATNSGTFTVDGIVQTPTSFAKDGYNTGLPYPFTIIELKNANYSLKINFNKFPLVDGEYSLGLSKKDGLVADIYIEDLKTESAESIYENQSSKITVMANKISFSGVTAQLSGKVISLSANFSVK